MSEPSSVPSETGNGPEALNDSARVEELAEQFLDQLLASETPERRAWTAAHPDIADLLDRRLAMLELVHRAAGGRASDTSSGTASGLEAASRQQVSRQQDEAGPNPPTLLTAGPEPSSEREEAGDSSRVAATLVHTVHLICPACGSPVALPSPLPAEVLCLACGHVFPPDTAPSLQLQDALATPPLPRPPHVVPPSAFPTLQRGPQDLPSQVARFQVLTLLGKGSFGVVYKAWDPGLERTVAVKVPRGDGFASRTDADRFQREAKSAARLRHPGIVPVHEVGDVDGLPFIVSDYVEGVSLADLIAIERPAFRAAAGLVEQIAEAVDHAHRQGVIHRDLKPSNILLDRAGRPLVTDFGLARRSDGSEATLTVEGQVLGTPAYMSPEQAAGDHSRVGVASDIYSLGVILYELLTGELPFRGQPRRVLYQVMHEEPPPPRRLDDRIPHDLDTIVLKCLNKEPERRYQTAADLAADLNNWLASKPIQARPIGLWGRWVKWTRRRPGLATSLAVTSVAVLSLVFGSLWYNTRLGAALQETKEQRDKAQAHFQLAREAVDKMLTEVGQKHLRDLPEMEPVRQRLLTEALMFYQRFAQEQSGDPGLRTEVGRAHQRMGEINDLLGRSTEAEQAYLQAIDEQNRLAQEFPQEPVYCHDLATTYYNLGKLYMKMRQPKEADAETAYKQALDLYTRLTREHPQEVKYQSALASAHNGLGVLYWYMGGRWPEVEDAYRQAREIQKTLADNHPTVSEYRSDLARTNRNLGLVYHLHGQHDKAEAAYREVLEIWAELARANPNVPLYQYDLSRSQDDLGNICQETNRPEEAETAYREAVRLREQLVRQHPAVPEYAIGYGETYVHLGNLLRDHEQPQKSLSCYEQTIDTLTEVHRKDPQNSDAKDILFQAYSGHARALTRLQRHAEALPDWKQALELDPWPKQDRYRVARALAWSHVGEHARAAAEAKKLAAQKKPSGELYDLASIYALAAAAPRREAQPPTAGDESPAESHAASAVQLLRRAHDAGYFKTPARLAQLKEDIDFDALRGRTDFQQFVRALEEKAKDGSP
jgi:tetratricopeptide (TPR) repeat protein/predicted Ser/Thr protein kinase